MRTILNRVEFRAKIKAEYSVTILYSLLSFCPFTLGNKSMCVRPKDLANKFFLNKIK